MIERLLNLITFGRVALVDDGGDFQRLQIVRRATGTGGGERITDRVIRLADFGFASAPPADADALVLNRNGDSAHALVVATAHRASRPRNLGEGDVVVYDARGRALRLTATGIEIDAAGGDVTVTNAAKVRCTCNVETTGDVIARADGERVSLAHLHDVFNVHVHPPITAGAEWGSGPPKPKA